MPATAVLEQPSTMLADVAAIAQSELCPRVREIDEGAYPEDIMRAIGATGAYGAHMGGGSVTLTETIEAISTVAEHCISTAFCMWCQNALGWYITSSGNKALVSLGAKVGSGQILGGTGLSNPMKTFFGIEKMRLKGTRVEGGYVVRGALPWVSNVGEDGFFGMVFETTEDEPKRIMAVADCAQEGVKTVLDHEFMAMGGTATRAIQFRDAFLPDDMILSDPIDGYLQRIRPGFVLMQCGMAIGMIRSSIALMRQVEGQLGHVNKYLEDQPEDFEKVLAEAEAEISELALTPYDTSVQYFRRVVALRLKGGETAMKAAHAAMLHQGARGYVSGGAAQRRLREAYFIGIVTPATKQLRKMLHDLPQA